MAQTTKRLTSRPEKSTAKAVAKRRVPPIPEPLETVPVAIHGVFIDTVNVISKTAASLHLLPGRLGGTNEEDRQTVLVPFVEMRLGGNPIREHPEDDEPTVESTPTVFATSIPLENFAFLLLDLTSDLKRICQEVTSVGPGALTIDPARMSHVRYFVAHLERQARICRVRLDRAYGMPEPVEE